MKIFTLESKISILLWGIVIGVLFNTLIIYRTDLGKVLGSPGQPIATCPSPQNLNGAKCYIPKPIQGMNGFPFKASSFDSGSYVNNSGELQHSQFWILVYLLDYLFWIVITLIILALVKHFKSNNPK